MDMRRLLGRNVRKCRVEAGLTQEQLSERSGFSQQYISDMERGLRNPTIVSLYELAQALGTTPVVLITPDPEAAAEGGRPAVRRPSMSDEPNAARLFLAALADRIRDWREALEVSQATVAERSGLSVSTIRRIEAGTIDPRITTLWALAKALETEVYELADVGGEDLGIAADEMLKTG